MDKVKRTRIYKIRKPTKNWIERTCLICKSLFKARPYLVKKGHGIYCSRKCHSSANGRSNALTGVMKGENNPNWKGGIKNDRYRYKLIDKERHPEKHKARDAVGKAKRSGKLIPKPCFICGKNEVHAHHDDYSKPLQVKWLCIKCHSQEHHG